MLRAAVSHSSFGPKSTTVAYNFRMRSVANAFHGFIFHLQHLFHIAEAVVAHHVCIHDWFRCEKSGNMSKQTSGIKPYF